MFRKKIVYFKRIYNFGSQHFSIRAISFVHNLKILLKIKKLSFASKKKILFCTKFMQGSKKSFKKIVHLKNIYKLAPDYFFISYIF